MISQTVSRKNRAEKMTSKLENMIKKKEKERDEGFLALSAL